MPDKLQKGMRVQIRLAGSADEWCPAIVWVATDNGKSIALALEGGVRASGGWVAGAIPLLVDYEAQTVRSIFGHDEYEVQIAQVRNNEEERGGREN